MRVRRECRERFPRHRRVSDSDMHHGTCVTHVPWCMPGLLTSGFLWRRWRVKTFPAFPAHAQPSILGIWQEAHNLQADIMLMNKLPKWSEDIFVSYRVPPLTPTSLSVWTWFTTVTLGHSIKVEYVVKNVDWHVCHHNNTYVNISTIH